MVQVSVIIPTYNRGKLLIRAIESILAQTYKDFEIIIIDDGSSDNTITLLWPYLQINKVRYFKNDTRRGAQFSRNKGIKEARGGYIAFLDSDDEWLPEKLQLQMEVLRHRKELVVVHGRSLVYYEENQEMQPFNVRKLTGNIYKELLLNPGPLFQCILAPKKCFEQIGFLDEAVSAYQEWDTSISLARLYEFIEIDNYLCVYHIHKGETISKNPLKAADGWAYIIKKNHKDILKYCGKAALATHYSRIGKLYYDANEFKQARHYFHRAFLLTGFKNHKIIINYMLSLLGNNIYSMGLKCVRRLIDAAVY